MKGEGGKGGLSKMIFFSKSRVKEGAGGGWLEQHGRGVEESSEREPQGIFRGRALFLGGLTVTDLVDL